MGACRCTVLADNGIDTDCKIRRGLLYWTVSVMNVVICDTSSHKCAINCAAIQILKIQVSSTPKFSWTALMYVTEETCEWKIM